MSEGSKNLFAKLAFAALCSAFLLLAACEEEEMNDLAVAQRCLDEARVPTDADECRKYVVKYDSQQANILKCSIEFFSGGLTSQRIASAYKALDGADDDGGDVENKEAVYIGVLALNDTDTAKAAQRYCQLSGVSGLIYLANLSVIGSILANSPGGFTVDPENPPTESQVNAAIDHCQTTPADCDPEAIADTIVELGDIYCTGENADTDVCTKINGAIEESGGDSDKIADALYCVLEGGTYDPDTQTCTP